MPLRGMIPVNIQINVTTPETIMIVLPDAKNRTIVWTKHRNVTERLTDRQNPSS